MLQILLLRNLDTEILLFQTKIKSTLILYFRLRQTSLCTIQRAAELTCMSNTALMNIFPLRDHSTATIFILCLLPHPTPLPLTRSLHVHTLSLTGDKLPIIRKAVRVESKRKAILLVGATGMLRLLTLPVSATET